MSNTERDMSASAGWFSNIVWPQIADWFGDSPDLYRTEDYDDELRKRFDRTAGVDFWVAENGRGMVSIASRVQTYDKTTFTVRYSRETGNDTEYQKRMRALNDDYELPTYTIQAYIDPTLKVLRNAAACRTDELYTHIATGDPGEDWPLIGSNESEYFFPVPWGELDDKADLLIYDRHRAGLPKRPDQPDDITAWVDA